jgi:hypothetical protein
MVERREQRGLDCQQLCARIGKDVLKLRPARGDIDRDGDRAEPSAAKVHLHEFRSVGAHQGDPVAWMYACRSQCPGEARRRRSRLFETPAYLTGAK